MLYSATKGQKFPDNFIFFFKILLISDSSSLPFNKLKGERTDQGFTIVLKILS